MTNKFLLAGFVIMSAITFYLLTVRKGLVHELRASRIETASVAEEAASLRVKLAAFEGDLARERERADRLTAPRTVGDTVALNELGAVPELYVNKEFQVTGTTLDKVYIAEPVTWFRLQGDGAFLHCVFKPQDLDANSRRLLVSKEPRSFVRVQGRYVPNGQGPSRSKGGTHTGYEFVVSQVVE